jgi:hypothetical protein
MAGPPISIQCECGETRSVAYGERWTCERCGRRWNTGQIPPGEYSKVLREIRWYRRSILSILFFLIGTFGVLGIFVSSSFFLLLPVFLALAFAWYTPLSRRRMRRRLKQLPQWELHPE